AVDTDEGFRAAIAPLADAQGHVLQDDRPVSKSGTEGPVTFDIRGKQKEPLIAKCLRLRG
ncbi:MAG: hypothetical protein U1E22_08550, partial [Coriobacteriia bacterium]|nr:hypothetical protein [Coriobacteriia bacterium]